MYKYFDFKKIFEADESMMPEEGVSPTTSEPEIKTVDLKKANATSKLHLLLTGTEVDQLKTQGFLNKTAEWKEIDNETKIVPMQVSIYNADSGKPAPTVEDGVLSLTITNQKLEDILLGIDGGGTVETEIPSTDKTLEGQPVRVSLTREIDVTSVKPGEIAVPASAEQLADDVPAPTEGSLPESVRGLMKFDEFVNEAKKKEKWIGKVDMKEGALKKSLKKDKITSDLIAKELSKLENKRLTESDLTRIVKRIINEDIDYNETTEEFYKIQDMLVNLAEKGEFVLHVTDWSNGTNETYGDNEPFSSSKKEVYVRINQPMLMVIVPRGTDKYFGRDFTDLLTKQFIAKFPKMNFSGDYGYSIEVRPKKFIEQGFYGE